MKGGQIITFRNGHLDWTRTHVMGILNVTPDSFSDSAWDNQHWSEPNAVLDRALQMVEAGADFLDIGGESTRPDATPVDVDEECRRVLPIVEHLAHQVPVPISVDTTKGTVAERACHAGAQLVNDISGGVFDPRIAAVANDCGAAFICGHVRGTNLRHVHNATEPTYDEVRHELWQRFLALPDSLKARTILDPCLGFGKGTKCNLRLIAECGALGTQDASTRIPVLIGPSRKRFLGAITGRSVQDRDAATVGACLAAAASGAQIVRVHNVAMTADALRVWQATRESTDHRSTELRP